jgi:hypothetical protein
MSFTEHAVLARDGTGPCVPKRVFKTRLLRRQRPRPNVGLALLRQASDSHAGAMLSLARDTTTRVYLSFKLPVFVTHASSDTYPVLIGNSRIQGCERALQRTGVVQLEMPLMIALPFAVYTLSPDLRSPIGSERTSQFSSREPLQYAIVPSASRTARTRSTSPESRSLWTNTATQFLTTRIVNPLSRENPLSPRSIRRHILGNWKRTCDANGLGWHDVLRWDCGNQELLIERSGDMQTSIRMQHQVLHESTLRRRRQVP